MRESGFRLESVEGFILSTTLHDPCGPLVSHIQGQEEEGEIEVGWGEGRVQVHGPILGETGATPSTYVTGTPKGRRAGRVTGRGGPSRELTSVHLHPLRLRRRPVCPVSSGPLTTSDGSGTSTDVGLETRSRFRLR